MVAGVPPLTMKLVKARDHPANEAAVAGLDNRLASTRPPTIAPRVDIGSVMSPAPTARLLLTLVRLGVCRSVLICFESAKIESIDLRNDTLLSPNIIFIPPGESSRRPWRSCPPSKETWRPCLTAPSSARKAPCTCGQDASGVPARTT